jgi:alpha-glucosidase
VLGWPLEKGRDGERTPMQWTSGPNADYHRKALVASASFGENAQCGDRKQGAGLRAVVLQARVEVAARRAGFREGKYVGLNESDQRDVTYGSPAMKRFWWC